MQNTGIMWRRHSVAISPVQVRSPVLPKIAAERTPPKKAPAQTAMVSASRPTRTLRISLPFSTRVMRLLTQSSGRLAVSFTPALTSWAWSFSVTSACRALVIAMKITAFRVTAHHRNGGPRRQL